MTEEPKFHPLKEEAQPKTYAWCTCGLSKRQPFCDGSHGPTGKTPMIVEITEKKQVAWCTCKATNTPPFCDGSHRNLRGDG